jgi:hypothetical protein
MRRGAPRQRRGDRGGAARASVARVPGGVPSEKTYRANGGDLVRHRTAEEGAVGPLRTTRGRQRHVRGDGGPRPQHRVVCRGGAERGCEARRALGRERRPPPRPCVAAQNATTARFVTHRAQHAPRTGQSRCGARGQPRRTKRAARAWRAAPPRARVGMRGVYLSAPRRVEASQCPVVPCFSTTVGDFP